MRRGAIGGWLVIAAAVLLAVVGVLGTQGQSVVVSLKSDLASTLSFVGTALLALGALVIGVSGPSPLDGRLVRAGLVIGAVGLGGILASSVIAAGLTYDALQDMGFVVLLLGGGLAGALGFVLTAIGLLRAGGRPRLAGVLLLGGLVGAFVGGVAANELGLGTVGLLLAAAGAMATFLGVVALGLVAAGVRGSSVDA